MDKERLLQQSSLSFKKLIQEQVQFIGKVFCVRSV